MQGKLVKAVKNNSGYDLINPGEYYQDENGHWSGMTPNGHMCNLSEHIVTVNLDNTITVSSSIKVTTDQEVWHGYLKNGVWTEC